MFGLNPRRRRRRFSGAIIRNPRRSRRRGGYRSNPAVPISLGRIMSNPLGIVTNGFFAVGSAYMTNSIPNMFGLFPGTDMVSKLLRGVVRVVTGTFVYGAVRAIAPAQAPAAAVGAAVGSVGATVLDLMNTRLILGYGDVTQTPMTLFAGVGTMFGGGTTAIAGYGAYTRPMGAYTRRMGMAGIYGPGSMDMTGVGSSIYG